MGRVEFRDDLGTVHVIEVGDTPADILTALRSYGARGWWHGDLLAGGFRFPYDNAPDFDWRLLGCRRMDDDTVSGRGHTWTRRAHPDDAGLPAVKWSRPMQDDDPTSLADDLDLTTICLVTFRNGQRQEAFAVPQE